MDAVLHDPYTSPIQNLLLKGLIKIAVILNRILNNKFVIVDQPDARQYTEV